MKRRTKVGCIPVAAFVGLCVFSVWYTFRETYGLGVDSLWWLPPEAHNVTYYANGLTKLAEFDIEQKALERWCVPRKWPLRELGAGEHPMMRRSWGMLENRGILPTIPEASEAEREAGRRQRVIKSFGAGDLFFEERWPNNGGYRVGYDVQEKRGYYEFNHH